MSWPNSWQVQPGYAGYSTAAPPPTVAQAAVAASPAGYSTMTPEQYAQWQQWQQYQQQYAQWHAQYGEQYARQMGKPLPAVAAPMPLQHMGIATNVPPPVAVGPQQPIPAPVMAPAVAIPAAMPTVPVVAPPMPTTAAPPPPPEPHPDSVAANAPAPPPPEADDSEQHQKTAEELAFDEQFRKWEEEFDNWKRKNANHPDKNAYREYEKKFVECRKKLLERREQLRNKRLAEQAAAANAPSLAGGYQYNQPPPPPPPEEEAGMDVGLFKNALGGGGATGGGIPGLDLINEDEKTVKQNDDEVMEVINLDDEHEEKPNVQHLNEKQDNGKPPNASPVNALASLLKDPKVSALLNVISGSGNGQGVNLASLGGSHELLQQIQSAAGAVINNTNQNGNSVQSPINQAKMREPGAHTPLSDDRSRTSFHDDRRSVVSMDDQSRDFDDFNRGQPPPKRNCNEYNQGPPPNRGSGFGGYNANVPPPLMDLDLSRPPLMDMDLSRPPLMDMDLSRPPLLDIDLSRPPPPIGSQHVPRPIRSDQPSPALSNSSSTGRQRQSRWVEDNRNVKQEPDFNPEPMRNDFRNPPPIKDEPFNGSDCPPPNDNNMNYYDGHQDELQIDPELGTPCAVPKPEWMTEDEYEEIYDRFEDIEVFEERKFKMELAIKMLKEKKDKEREMAAAKNQPSRFGDNRNANSGVNSGGAGGGGGGNRWQGGMPKPLKQEPGEKRTNPFASDDDYFRPKQVIDYSNGTPRVFDYGHSSSGPVAKDVDSRVDHKNDWRGGPMSGAKDVDSRMDNRNDWRGRKVVCVPNNMKIFLFFTAILMIAGTVLSDVIDQKSDSEKISHEAISRTVRHFKPYQYAYGYAPSYHVGYYPHVHPIQPLNVLPVYVPLQGGGKRHKHQKFMNQPYGLVPPYPWYY